jgi:predicted permease
LPRVRSLPGVLAVGISNRLPLAGERSNNWVIPEGQKTPLAERPIADMRFVNAGFFETLAIPLERGRLFTEADKQKVVVVSAKMAARLFPGQNPLNRRFHLGDETSPLLEVVGVVGDLRGNGLQKAPAWTIYLPFWERDRQEMSLAVRTAIDPLGVATAIRQTIRSVDPELPVPQFSTMNQLMDDSVAHRRFQVRMVALFGGVALLLASLGVYGVVSYTVAQRTGELGIRLALGANPKEIGRLVLRQGMTPVIQGLGVGLVVALALGRIIDSLLFGVSAHDPLTIGPVIVLLASVAVFACWVPARRTMRIDPIQALRYE